MFDFELSEEKIREKYPQGSPDYPVHVACCACSGCHASWIKWTVARAAYEIGMKAGRDQLLNTEVRVVQAQAIRWAVANVPAGANWTELYYIAGRIERGEIEVE
jgi:hypothetical protein